MFSEPSILKSIKTIQLFALFSIISFSLNPKHIKLCLLPATGVRLQNRLRYHFQQQSITWLAQKRIWRRILTLSCKDAKLSSFSSDFPTVIKHEFSSYFLYELLTSLRKIFNTLFHLSFYCAGPNIIFFLHFYSFKLVEDLLRGFSKEILVIEMKTIFLLSMTVPKMQSCLGLAQKSILRRILTLSCRECKQRRQRRQRVQQHINRFRLAKQ